MSCIKVSSWGKVWRGWGFRGALAFIAVILLASMVLVPVAPVLAANWSHYATITIDDAKVPSTQTNFPVLISLTDDSLRTTGNGGDVGQDDGGDFVFTDDGNTVKYDHEIESYTPSTGALVAWVRIPTLNGTGSGDTIIRMWYGNASCSDQWNSTGVWDSNYKAVWHLKETSGTQYDSTSNDNDGTPNGGVTQGTTGKVDGADSFDGSNDYVSVPYSSNLDPSTYITVEYWFKAPASQPGAGDNLVVLVDNSHGFADMKGWVFQVRTLTGKLTWSIMTATGSFDTISISSVVDNNWHHAAGLLDGSKIQLYIDGVLQDTTTIDAAYYLSTGRPVYMGASWGGGTPQRYYSGLLDEIRVSSTARSVDWITTNYNNQSDTTIEAGHFITSVVYGTPAPVDPVPELPTIILISVGLTILGGYIWLRRRRRGLSAA